MSNQFKMSTARLAEIIKEEYAIILAEINGTTEVSEKKFPDLTGDGKVTKADILTGRGVIDDEEEEESEESKDDKKAQKESVDSIRDLIRKELESL
jgi:hypothetical protein